MTALRPALAAEALKLRRSAVPLATLVAGAAPAAIGAVFMLILADRSRARRYGLMGQKAQLTGMTADWSGLLSFAAQVVAVGGLMLFAFVAAWVFGREAQDGTLRYLLAVPVPRHVVVLAKLAVVVGWCAVLTAWIAALFVVAGLLLRLPGGGAATVLHGLGPLALAALLHLAVVPAPVAAVASAGRGYLGALAVAVGAVVAGQVAGALGLASAVPWSVPAVAAGLVPDTTLGPCAVLVAGLTAVVGVATTVGWWRSSAAGA